MGQSKGWLSKYTPKALKRRMKFLPKSAAEREYERAEAQRRKRQHRENHRHELRQKRREQDAACADLEWIKRFVVEVPERPGCWIWKGPWGVSFGKAKPVVRRYEYGEMHADRAVLTAVERPGLVKRNYAKTTCGHIDCVSPEHLYVTNQTLERARGALGRPAELESATTGATSRRSTS